jgi:hypothetical protein
MSKNNVVKLVPSATFGPLASYKNDDPKAAGNESINHQSIKFTNNPTIKLPAAANCTRE